MAILEQQLKTESKKQAGKKDSDGSQQQSSVNSR
jgi:hypothetical protein